MDAQQQEQASLLLVSQLRQLCEESGYNTEEVIDVEKCQTVLQVVAHDVPTALRLYWDDFLATSMATASSGHDPPGKNESDGKMHDRSDEPSHRDATSSHRQRTEQQEQPRHRVRRRLECEFRRFSGNRRKSAHRSNHEDEDTEEGQPIVHQPQQQAPAPFRDLRNDPNVADLAARAAGVAQRLLAARDGAGNEDDERASAVSDDEAGGVWRMVGGLAARFDQEPLLASTTTCSSDSPRRKRHKAEETTTASTSDEDDSAYLSDNDWLWESLSSRATIPLCNPSDLLWGSPQQTQQQDSENDGDGADTVAVEDTIDAPEVDRQQQQQPEGNVIVDDGDDDNDNDNNGEEESSSGEKTPGIPRSWLNAGFTMSKDGTGISLSEPDDEDVTLFSWQQQANNNVEQCPPPPYHCSSLSALASIVTGLLYTGVTVDNGQLFRSGVRKPFYELTESERKREFDSRLADALVLLLHIAAAASQDRKERKLRPLRTSREPAVRRQWQAIQPKLRLCPVCNWETDSGSGDIRHPLGRDSDKDLQIATTYTNIADLRCFVLSNMQSFTGRGGCALFLETIIRIHGKGAIQRMISKARKKAKLPESLHTALIDCNCQDLNKSLKIKVHELRKRSVTKEIMIACPKERPSCISVELLSLLLTGQVHAAFDGWSASRLGLGILSSPGQTVGTELQRPPCPVWIVAGPKMFSVLWMQDGFDKRSLVAKAERPDSVVELVHYCCWPAQRGKTNIRMSIPKSTVSRTGNDCSDDVNGSSSDLYVTPNPDDQRFYPHKYRLWRYMVSIDEVKTDDRNAAWTPYFRLTDREKYAVECKVGPTLNTLLWTRWPGAQTEGFTPELPPPIV